VLPASEILAQWIGWHNERLAPTFDGFRQHTGEKLHVDWRSGRFGIVMVEVTITAVLVGIFASRDAHDDDVHAFILHECIAGLEMQAEVGGTDIYRPNDIADRYDQMEASAARLKLSGVAILEDPQFMRSIVRTTTSRSLVALPLGLDQSTIDAVARAVEAVVESHTRVTAKTWLDLVGRYAMIAE